MDDATTDIGLVHPVPIDRTSMGAALRAAMSAVDCGDDPWDLADLLVSGAASVRSADPLRCAIAVVRAWETMNAWRIGRPGVDVLVVSADVREVSMLRSRGVDAATTFSAPSRMADPRIGLVVGLGLHGLGRDAAATVLDGPLGTRVLLVDGAPGAAVRP